MLFSVFVFHAQQSRPQNVAPQHGCKSGEVQGELSQASLFLGSEF